MSAPLEKMAFTVNEAAMRVNLGRDSIYNAIRERKLAAVKAGRRTLITAEALKIYLDSLPPLQLPPAA